MRGPETVSSGVLACALPCGLAAKTLQGRVPDGTSQQPLAGARLPPGHGTPYLTFIAHFRG